MQDKKPMPSDKKKPPYKRKYLEDSSNESDDSDDFPLPKKPLHQKKGSCSRSSPPVVLSDGERSPEKSKSATDRLSSLCQKVSLKSDEYTFKSFVTPGPESKLYNVV